MKLSVRSSSASAALLCFPVFLLIGCSGSSPSTTATPPVVNPSVTAVTPATVTAGATDTTLTVTGTNFSSSSSVQVGTVVEQTVFVSSTQLTATVPASQLASGATLPVIVLSDTATSAAGAAVDLVINNPAPTVTGSVPAAFLTGSVATSISVTGTGFVPTTAIQVNGVTHSTTFISSTQVNILLTPTDLAAAGSLTLTAVNVAPGGGTSAAASVPINNPVPILTALSPTVATAGATTPTTITLTGSGFVAGSTVLVGTVAHPTTLLSPTQLTFALTVADQATAGRLSITVTNPAPGGGTSAPATILVTQPTPTPVLTSLTPSTFIVGSNDSNLTVNGSNFTADSVVQWNGTPLTTSLIYSYSYTGNSSPVLAATVPAALLTSAGTATVTVTSPTAVVPLSNALTVTISNPPVPTLTSVSPGYGPIHAATPITVTGTDFTPQSTIAYNGIALPTTFGSSTSLTATIPSATVATPGNANITVVTPAPGGGTSTPQVFSAYIPLVTNSMIYNPADGLVYTSIPGSAGAPLGNSIVSVDPATGNLGTPIFVGSEPNKLALTADGKFLWVSLDGSAAVRKVDLTAKTAGLQFSLPLNNSGIYDPPATVLALAALPGATDSVIVAKTSNFADGNSIAIFDSGVQRPNTGTTSGYYNGAYALQTDGSRSEIYVAGSGYATYTYDSSGLTLKASNTSISPATSSADEVQLLSGHLYTDQGTVFDAESGSLLGTLYLTGSTAAQGATLADTTLGKIFVVDNTGGLPYAYGYNQIQIFNLADFTTASTTIPVNVPSSSPITTTSIYSVTATRLTRWGANGLVFHTPFGIYSLQSNAVVDLSSTSADLGVTLATSGSTITGGSSVFTATVTNAGPSTATDVVVSATAPAIGSLVSAVPSSGTCSTSSGITCAIGSLASGASTTVTITVLQTSAGASTVTAQVSGSTTDPVAGNNSTSATATVTGDAYSLSPTVSSITPAAIETGSADTTITVNGAGFSSGSVVQLGAAPLITTFNSPAKLTATVPSASLANLGWAAITVTTPSPGGGTSAPLPLTIFSVMNLGANHIVYDPYSRQIITSVGSGSSTVTGNSIAAITPETSAISTPVSVGSQPTEMALTSDGQILYAIISGSESVARFNMLTRQLEYTYTPPSNSSFVGGIALRGIAAQPGTEDTIALDIASFTGNAIYDFDPTHQTAAIRGQASGPYSGSCISFLDANNLLAFDTDTSGASLDHYTVTAAGFTYYNYSQYTVSTLTDFGCFRISGGLVFANAGGIANPSTVPATQVATLPGLTGGGFSTTQALAPDTSLERGFYPAVGGSYSTAADGISAYDLTRYQLSTTLPLNMPTIEGVSTSYSDVDIVRWGQDGLALLTSGGHIYLLRGPVVVPQLLNTNSAATLSSVSSTTLAHGTGNTLLTLTGSGFVPGVAVTWNGSYRTTTIVDATHLTVAIPASDLAAAGTASLVVTNPGAPASGSLTVTVQ